MGNYIKKHLEWIKKENMTNEELDYLLNVIKFVQHERAIHLTITIITAIFFFIFGMFFLIEQNIITSILFIIFTILLIFYIKYYCFMENSIQSLYKKYSKEKKYY